jgi:diguanylate cyclase (GGDEF)-like protein
MNFRRKLFFAVLFPTLLVVGGAVYLVYRAATDNLLEQLQMRLQVNAQVAAHLLGTPSTALYRQNKPARPVSAQAVKALHTITELDTDIAHAYVMQRVGNGAVFVIDNNPDLQRRHHPGDAFEGDTAALLRGFQTPTADTLPSSTQDGDFLSGYAPIPGYQGKYLVGVAMRKQTLAQSQTTLYLGLAICVLGTLIFSAALALLVSWRLARRLERLAIDCRALTEAGLGQRPSVPVANHFDEIRQLEEDFSVLRTQLITTTEERRAAHLKVEQAFLDVDAQVSLRTRKLRDANSSLLGDLEALQKLNLRLDLDARTDSLTTLLNRRGLLAALDETIGDGKPHALLLLDIDHFKRVNDECGHDEGDRLLRCLAQKITQVLAGEGPDTGPLNLCCRWGGEEFAVLLSDTRLGDALYIAERLRAAIAELPAPPCLSGMPHLSVSIGVADAGGSTHHAADHTEHPTDAPRQPFDVLFRRADEALYQAKETGRNRVVYFSMGG